MFHEEDGSFIQYKDTFDHDIGEPIIYVEELMERYKAYTGKELKYRGNRSTADIAITFKKRCNDFILIGQRL